MSDVPVSDPADQPGISNRSVAPMILVPDASAGVKWFVPEPDSEQALRLLDGRFELHAPSYFFTEVASVLQRKIAVERTVPEAEGLEAFQQLQTAPMVIHPTQALLEGALRLGIRYRRPVYDSLYLVLAASIGGQVVTADRRLHRGVQGGPLEPLVLLLTDLP